MSSDSVNTANDAEVNSSAPRMFPLEVLLPKAETQQESFIKEHPEYDGRGIVLAILDTGVDPSLPGMQTTTTGERKMIDCVDCSGAGDVDTSTVKTAVDGVVVGITGRNLKIPESWVNPTGKWHLGAKPIYELYPKSLREKMKKEKKTDIWDPAHQIVQSDTLRSMTKHEDALGGNSDKLADKLEREDLASKLDFLKNADRMDDKGPVADCLVWHDGKQWMACLDTSFRGRLNLCQPMGAFRATGEFGKLTDRDEATYTFRIDSKGNWLEICVTNSAHGSHVANIAAAHFPGEPKKNGLAPGAKVVSFMIGDNRLDAMETGTALTRAFNLCAEYGVHVANLSFGEGTHLPNQGRIIEELQQLVDQKNVVFMISAGNNGPALSTVGAPGGTSSGVIGVGAYLTSEMAEPLYGVFNEVQGNLYPWSARGPATDGWLGVSVCAPGAALTGVPRYCRESAMMMNGTSMSSPNAAGSVACILSGLLANQQPWTAYQVRVALENSAKATANDEKFSQGRGLVQISNAYEYLRKAGEFLPPTLRDFKVSITSGAKTTRGVYLREAHDTDSVKEFVVGITPRFMENSDVKAHINLEKHMLLETTANWITTPDSFVATAAQRSFFMEVDPTALEPGTSNYGEVLGYDACNYALGPLFRVPVTVIRPEVVAGPSYSAEFNFDAPSGMPVRHFVTAPEGATIAEVKVTNLSQIPLDRFVLHKVYLEQDKCFRNSESYKMLGPDHHEWTHVMPVKAGKTVEFCLARSWNRGCDKPAKMRMNITFHGVVREPICLTHEAGAIKAVASAANFRPVSIQPTVSFKSLVVPLKQSATARIEPLGPQDIFAPGIQIHRMLLTYKLTLSKASDVSVELPGLSDLLYESPIDCLRYQVYNATKGYVGSASTYPDRYSLKLEKGEYTIQAQLRHPKESFLETLRDVPLHAHFKLASPITLDAYRTPAGAMSRNGATAKYGKVTVHAGEEFSMYFGSLNDDKLPKVTNLVAGSYLSGELKMFADADKKAVEKSPVRYNFTEYSTRTPKAPSMITLKEKEAKPEQKVEFEDAMRDLKISWLEKLKDETEATKLYTELLQQYPSHLPLLMTKLKQLMEKKNRSPTETDTLNVLLSQILEVCQPAEVQQYLGCRQEHNEEYLAQKKKMDERKAAVIEALLAKATLLVDGHLAGSTLDIPPIFKRELVNVIELKAASLAKNGSNGGKNGKNGAKDSQSSDDVRTAVDKPADPVARKDVDAAYADVLKWIAPDDNKCLLLSAKHAMAHGHSGRALKYLWKAVEDGRGDGKDTLLAEKTVSEICSRLGWIHIANQMNNDMLVRHSEKFRSFQAM